MFQDNNNDEDELVNRFAQGDANEYTMPQRYLSPDVEKIKLIACKSYVIEFFSYHTRHLKSIRATHLPHDNLSLVGILKQENLNRLVIKFEENGMIVPGIHMLQLCENLSCLILINIKNIVLSDIRSLTTLLHLRVLELGHVRHITQFFAKQEFPKFKELQHLRLQSYSHILNYADFILEGVQPLINLESLELVNFTVRNLLVDTLSNCFNFQKFLIAPKAIGTGIVTFNIILKALMKAPRTLKTVTWVLDAKMKEKCETCYEEVILNMDILKFKTQSMLPNINVNFVVISEFYLDTVKFID